MEIKCDSFQEEGEYCKWCGTEITNSKSICETCDNDPKKDEWKW